VRLTSNSAVLYRPQRALTSKPTNRENSKTGLTTENTEDTGGGWRADHSNPFRWIRCLRWL